MAGFFSFAFCAVVCIHFECLSWFDYVCKASCCPSIVKTMRSLIWIPSPTFLYHCIFYFYHQIKQCKQTYLRCDFFFLLSLPFSYVPLSDHLRPGVMERGTLTADEWLWHRGPDASWTEATASCRQGAYNEQPHLWRHPPGTRVTAVCHRGPGIWWVRE